MRRTTVRMTGEALRCWRPNWPTYATRRQHQMPDVVRYQTRQRAGMNYELTMTHRNPHPRHCRDRPSGPPRGEPHERWQLNLELHTSCQSAVIFHTFRSVSGTDRNVENACTPLPLEVSIDIQRDTRDKKLCGPVIVRHRSPIDRARPRDGGGEDFASARGCRGQVLCVSKRALAAGDKT